MIPKILHWLGLAACITLILSSFLPWCYYADLNQTFTGFYSYQNSYGKPGLLLTILSVLIFVFMLIPKIWSRRANLFLCALCVGYAIKSYVLFTACYRASCPDKKVGLYLMLISIFFMLLAAILPDLKLGRDSNTDKAD